jgi:hypothetical protein
MENPRHWRLRAQRYRLEGSLCPVCGQPIFPPRPVCPHCKQPQAGITGGELFVIPVSIAIPAVTRIFESIPSSGG